MLLVWVQQLAYAVQLGKRVQSRETVALQVLFILLNGVALVLFHFCVRPIERDGLEQLLNLFVLARIDGVVDFVDEEVVVLLLGVLLVLLFESLEVLFAFN